MFNPDTRKRRNRFDVLTRLFAPPDVMPTETAAAVSTRVSSVYDPVLGSIPPPPPDIEQERPKATEPVRPSTPFTPEVADIIKVRSPFSPAEKSDFFTAAAERAISSAIIEPAKHIGETFKVSPPSKPQKPEDVKIKDPFWRALKYVVGLSEAGMAAFPPMMGANAILGVIQPAIDKTTSDIAEANARARIGKYPQVVPEETKAKILQEEHDAASKKINAGVGLLVARQFGIPVLRGSVASMAAEEAARELLQGSDLTEDQKRDLITGASTVSFFAGAAASPEIATRIRESRLEAKVQFPKAPETYVPPGVKLAVTEKPATDVAQQKFDDYLGKEYVGVQHYGAEGIRLTQPKLRGTGAGVGEEGPRVRTGKAVPGTYLYFKGVTPERRVKNLPRYTGLLDKTTLYDLDKDPAGVLTKTNGDPFLVERAIKKQGYSGFYRGGASFVFDPQELVRVYNEKQLKIAPFELAGGETYEALRNTLRRFAPEKSAEILDKMSDDIASSINSVIKETVGVKAKIQKGTGVWNNELNPNYMLVAEKGTSPERFREAVSLVRELADQEAALTYRLAEKRSAYATGSERVGNGLFIRPAGEATPDLQAKIREIVEAESGGKITGMTIDGNGVFHILNVKEWSALSPEEFFRIGERIARKVSKLNDVDISMENVYYDIEQGKRRSQLKGDEYDQRANQKVGAGTSERASAAGDVRDVGSRSRKDIWGRFDSDLSQIISRYSKDIERRTAEQKPASPSEKLIAQAGTQGVPVFRSTNEAEAFGAKTPEAIPKLESLRETALAEHARLLAAEKYDEALALGSQAQFYREAKEAALDAKTRLRGPSNEFSSAEIPNPEIILNDFRKATDSVRYKTIVAEGGGKKNNPQPGADGYAPLEWRMLGADREMATSLIETAKKHGYDSYDLLPGKSFHDYYEDFALRKGNSGQHPLTAESVNQQYEQFRNRASEAWRIIYADNDQSLSVTLSKMESEAKKRIMERGDKIFDFTGATVESVKNTRDLAIIGASKIYRGAVDFARWSEEMLRDFGDSIRPHLEKLFEESKRFFDQRINEATDNKFASTNRLLDLYQKGEYGQEWYDRTRTELKKIFGDDTDKFIDILAATSVRKNPADNLKLALRAYSTFKLRGEMPSDGMLKTVAGMLEKIAGDERFGGPKVQRFAQALKGDENAVVIDSWMMRAFGFKRDVPTAKQYQFLENVIRDVADAVGVTPRQLQSAIWVGIKGERGRKRDVPATYERLLNEKLAQEELITSPLKEAISVSHKQKAFDAFEENLLKVTAEQFPAQFLKVYAEKRLTPAEAELSGLNDFIEQKARSGEPVRRAELEEFLSARSLFSVASIVASRGVDFLPLDDDQKKKLQILFDSLGVAGLGITAMKMSRGATNFLRRVEIRSRLKVEKAGGKGDDFVAALREEMNKALNTEEGRNLKAYERLALNKLAQSGSVEEMTKVLNAVSKKQPMPAPSPEKIAAYETLVEKRKQLILDRSLEEQQREITQKSITQMNVTSQDSRKMRALGEQQRERTKQLQEMTREINRLKMELGITESTDVYGNIINTEKPDKHNVIIRKEFADAAEKLNDLNTFEAGNYSTTDPLRAATKIDGKNRGAVRNSIVEPGWNGNFKAHEELYRLRGDLRNLLKETGVREYSPSLNPLTGFRKVSDSSRRIFQAIEGRLEGSLTRNEQRVADFLKQKYDDFLTRLNETRRLVNLPPIPKRDNYITHFRELGWLDDFFGLTNDKVNSEMLAQPEYVRPNNPFFRFMLERKGGPFEENAIGAFQQYYTPAIRNIHLTIPIVNAKAYLKHLPPNAQKYFATWVNEALVGRANVIDKQVPRWTLKLLQSTAGRIGKNLIVGVPSVAINQLNSHAQTMAEAGVINFVKGAASTFSGKGWNLAEQYSKILRLREYEGIEDIHPSRFNVLEKMSAFPLEFADRMSVRISFNAGLKRAIAEGKSFDEAVAFADDFAMRTQAAYGRVYKAPILRSQLLSSTALQFQTYTTNLMNYLIYDIFSKRGGEGNARVIGKLGTFVAAMNAINYVYEYGFGLQAPYSPQAFVPMYNQLLTMVLGSENDELIEQAGGSGKFAAPPAFKTIGEIGVGAVNVAVGTISEDDKRVDKGFLQILRNAPLVLAPFGGNQIRKTAEGYAAIEQDGVYNSEGKRLFKVEGTDEYIRTLIFGKYGSEAAKEYLRKLEENRSMFHKPKKKTGSGELFSQPSSSGSSQFGSPVP